MNYGPRALSPAQIQYLRIGPKAGGSDLTKKQLSQAIRQEINKQYAGEISGTSSFNKIPKLTYGEFEKTVSNFGVLINKNFGNETSIHQSQKFGNIAKKINRIMLEEKDRPPDSQKKNAIMKKIKDRSDNRTTIKTIYDFMGQKLHVTLKSFVVQSQKSNEGGLPIPYLRFLIHHVNSSRLAKIIESSIRAQGNQVVVQFDKIQSRAAHFSNNQAKYQNIQYMFERMGQQLTISLPFVEFHHVQTNYTQRVQLLNKEILQIIDNNFDNVADIVDKYLQAGTLQAVLEQSHNEQVSGHANRSQEHTPGEEEGESNENVLEPNQQQQEDQQQLQLQQQGYEGQQQGTGEDD